MKRWLTGILVCLMLLAGCGSNPAGDGTFSERDLAIVVENQRFEIGQPVDDLLSVLGEDFDYSEQENASYDGLDKRYEYETVQIHTVPFEGKDLIAEVYVFGGDIKTDKEIGVGSTRADAEAAYGTNYTYEEGQLAYWAGEKGDINTPCLYLALDTENTVSEIFVIGMPLETKGE